MRISSTLRIIFASAAIATTGCASQEDLHLSRRPPLPPTSVIKASPAGPYYRNVAIEDVQGTPEFLLFAGGGLVTTRPTHKQVLETYTDELATADLLAPSRLSSEYMLYVKFVDLRGPDVWVGSDKRASARITFHLVRWRTGEVVKEQQIEVAYLAKSPGYTAREAVASGVGLGAAVASGFAITRVYEGVDGISAIEADAIGAGGGGLAGIDVGRLVLLGLNAGSVPRNEYTPLSLTNEIGPVDGADRRSAAVNGLLGLALEEFLHELSKDGSVVYKKAVSCADLNPNLNPNVRFSSNGYQLAFVGETLTEFGIDCPNARFVSSRLFSVYPNDF